MWKSAERVKIEKEKKERFERFLASLFLSEGVKGNLTGSLKLNGSLRFRERRAIIQMLKGLQPLEDPATLF